MKVFENDLVYNYPASHTLNFLHRKYPNPFATHVYSVDTMERSIDPETGILRSERLIGVQQGAPKWVTKLFHLPPIAYVREVVFIDPSGTSATSMSVNLNLAQYISCLEHITYTQRPDNTTLFRQRAMLVSGFPTKLIARKIEQASYDRFKSNAGIGKQGFDWVLAGN
ncbi:mitochondrial protein [Cryptococcus gattii Ru294]|uniref:Mitochondrion protein, putative n=2 Tax=Cryptococcus gattii TaxID=37769 RepID=E6RDX7_CRYGW|nr:Mitochondrion protein, putative [Cryptococcus gattii WM276]KIR51084.1 mitochondrial protein [Cryptococcus gattii Ru294]KIR79017.1 mitochondrial protein [Cryptococcus gattii EJB2]KIY30817.1 mitochondrial protein [Cryptococcus gattii E566]KJE01698.1 mitochondrial protein [Cryptococcus gattii NT-10]ADV25085.1 Mitochondrion protein, putative [Cryptococcus gattii WM276]